MNPIGNQIGPFMYSGQLPLVQRKVKGVEFIIGVASAYNAMGLIGSEHNGVFVLDHTNKQVVCDQIAITSSGWFGVTAEQKAEYEFLKKAPAKKFCDYIRAHKRYRGVALPA